MKSLFSLSVQSVCKLLLASLLLASCEVEKEFTLSLDRCNQVRSYSGSSGGSQKSEPVSLLDAHTYIDFWLFDLRIPWDDSRTIEGYGPEVVSYGRAKTSAIYLHPGIGFTQKGARNLFPGGKTQNSFNYIDAPVTIRFRQQYTSGNNWSAGLGPYFASAVGGNIKSTNNGQTTKTKIDFGNGGYRRFDAGLVVSGNYIFRQGVVFGVHYMHGLANISTSNISKTKNRLIGIELGYALSNLLPAEKKKQ